MSLVSLMAHATTLLCRYPGQFLTYTLGNPTADGSVFQVHPSQGRLYFKENWEVCSYENLGVWGIDGAGLHYRDVQVKVSDELDCTSTTPDQNNARTQR